MKSQVLLSAILLLLATTTFSQTGNRFKFAQMEIPKVKEAYLATENDLKKEVVAKGFDSFTNHIYMRVFKYERILELWIKSPSKNSYTLFKRYKFCDKLGEFGPKSLLGDYKIPEGLYSIKAFNPDLNGSLALELNYPNPDDVKRKVQNDRVYVVGECPSKGNLPLQPEMMQEIYVMAVEARAASQQDIPIHIYPAVLNDRNYEKLISLYPHQQELHSFWAVMKLTYMDFSRSKSIENFAALAGESLGSTMANNGQSPENKKIPKPAQAAVVPVTMANYKHSASAAKPAEKIKVTVAEAAPNTQSKPANIKAEVNRHTVSAGETLFAISQAYGIKVEQIKNWNGLTSNNIKVGQTLKVDQPNFYTASKGDNLYSIAKKHGLSLKELLKLNNKAKNPTLLVGEELIVK